MQEELIIESFKQGDEKEIAELIKRVFSEFVASDNTPEGNQFFYEFLASGEILKRTINKIDNILVAKVNDKIIGVLSVKNGNHISLLFVDKKFHGRGIAKRLFNQYLRQVKNTGIREMTVNASLYSVEIYKSLAL